jgi:hypothetical protein
MQGLDALNVPAPTLSGRVKLKTWFDPATQQNVPDIEREYLWPLKKWRRSSSHNGACVQALFNFLEFGWVDWSILCPECTDYAITLERILEQQRKRMSELPYSDYLQSDWWAYVRNEKLRTHRDCQICSSSINLNVHHRTYETIGREAQGDLLVLCYLCHAKFHDKLPRHPQ